MTYQPIYVSGTTNYSNGNRQEFHSGSQRGKGESINVVILGDSDERCSITVNRDKKVFIYNDNQAKPFKLVLDKETIINALLNFNSKEITEILNSELLNKVE